MELLVSTGAVLQQRKVEQAVDEAGPAGVQQALLLVEVFQVERADGGVRRRRRAGRRDGGGSGGDRTQRTAARRSQRRLEDLQQVGVGAGGRLRRTANQVAALERRLLCGPTEFQRQ